MFNATQALTALVLVLMQPSPVSSALKAAPASRVLTLWMIAASVHWVGEDQAVQHSVDFRPAPTAASTASSTLHALRATRPKLDTTSQLLLL